MLSEGKSAKNSSTVLASNLSAPSSPTLRKRNSSTANPRPLEAEKVRAKFSKDWRAAKTDRESASKIPTALAMIYLIRRRAKRSSSPKLAGDREEDLGPRIPVSSCIGMLSGRVREKNFCKNKRRWRSSRRLSAKIRRTEAPNWSRNRKLKISSRFLSSWTLTVMARSQPTASTFLRLSRNFYRSYLHFSSKWKSSV